MTGNATAMLRRGSKLDLARARQAFDQLAAAADAAAQFDRELYERLEAERVALRDLHYVISVPCLACRREFPATALVGDPERNVPASCICDECDAVITTDVRAAQREAKEARHERRGNGHGYHGRDVHPGA
jgi:hypothetical protein